MCKFHTVLQNTPHLLPWAFLQIHNFMPSQRREESQVSKDSNGFRENCPGSLKSIFHLSRDSVCDTGLKQKGKLLFDILNHYVVIKNITLYLYSGKKSSITHNTLIDIYFLKSLILTQCDVG